MRIDSLGINTRIDYNKSICKECNETLSLLAWSLESTGGLMVCTNNICILKNHPQKFIDYEKVRVRRFG